MADEPENVILEHLRALRGDVTAINAKLDRLAGDQAALKTEQRSQSRTLSILLQDSRLIRAAVNDLAKEKCHAGRDGSCTRRSNAAAPGSG
jgi:hypothetical protein